MRLFLILGVLITLAACGKGKGEGEAVSHFPLTVNGITYQWPYDSTTNFDDLGRPENWKGTAYIPAGIWNETIGAVPEFRRSGWKGQITLSVMPARAGRWAIESDGKGLPLLPGERFVTTERGQDFTVGKVVGERIVSPSVLVVFDAEKNAYAECRAPEGADPKGTCNLLLNDRGVKHTIPLGWGNWKRAKALLFLYRRLIGIPAATNS